MRARRPPAIGSLPPRRYAWLAAWAGAAVVFGVGCASAPRPDAPPAATCAALRERLALAGEKARAEPPVDGFRRLSRLLDAVSDDPEDCVSSELRRRIGALETKLVALQVGDETLFPDKVLHCNELVPPALACRGPELEETPLVDEARLLSTPPRAVPPLAAVTIAPGYDVRIVGLYAGERGALQDGAPPVALPIEQGAARLATLDRMKRPVLILGVHRSDSLVYRKFVWFF